MLSCHACRNRCLQTLVGESVIPSISRQPSLAPRRTFNSQTPPRSSSGNLEVAKTNPNHKSFRPDNGFKSQAISTSFKRQQWLESRGVTPEHKKRERQNDDLLMKKQLRHLTDPLKLAEHIRGVLRDDDFESALAIVRAASKDTQCIVSWNHLIDWQLSRHKMNGALRTYNEMKKRAQTPDAYTYTIIFRGCADHPLAQQALAKVISIYKSMDSENSPIKPNVIHLNSVLKMCAKAHDMDAMFSIAADMHTRGARAPNNMTYTIILNAIRMQAFAQLTGDLTPVQQRKNRQKANRDARLIWLDITKRWLKKDIILDEELVCTMGRVLLLGTNDDIEDILSLIEQTMNIPRQLDSSARRRESDVADATLPLLPLKDQGPESEVQDENSANELRNDAYATRVESHVEELGIVLSDTFKPLDTPNSKSKRGVLFFAKPGPNTISLLMAAFLDLRGKTVASKYWSILTQDYKVEPDAENYHGYLRILRQARASTETVKVLIQMPQDFMAVKTFRIAMSTCGRDRNNQHCFSNAGKVLDIMQSKISIPDIQALHTYLDIACSPTSHRDLSCSDWKDPNPAFQKGRQILRALHRVNPSYTNLRALLTYGDTSKRESSTAQKSEFTYSVLSLTQRMVSAYDLLMNRSMVDKTTYSALTKERSKLAAFITRFRHQKAAMEDSSVSRNFKDGNISSRREPSLELRRHMPFAKDETQHGAKSML